MWQRTGLWSSSHFSLFVQFLIIFFQLLLGFAPPCLSFSNSTIPAWQLHTAFIAISTQPPSSCSSLQTAPKPGWPVFASQAIQGPLPWTTSPERRWCRDRPSPCRPWDVGSPQELPSPQDHQQGSAEQQILWIRTGTFNLSCSRSSRSAQRRDARETWSVQGFGQADCGVTQSSHLKSKANNTQEATAMQSLAQVYLLRKVLWDLQHCFLN